MAATTRSCNSCRSVREDLLTCQGCSSVFYCNADCQKLDWKKSHKNNCKRLRDEREKKKTQRVIDAVKKTDIPCDGTPERRCSSDCRFCVPCGQYVCSTVTKQLHSFKSQWLYDTTMVISDKSSFIKPRRPSGMICTTCKVLFCFTCYSDNYCSKSNCKNVCCTNCGPSDMYFCVDCDKHFDFKCRPPVPVNCVYTCKNRWDRRCGCRPHVCSVA
jgi:hypothetical protein